MMNYKSKKRSIILKSLALSLVLCLALTLSPVSAGAVYEGGYTQERWAGTVGITTTGSNYEQLSRDSRVIYDALLANIENTKSGTYAITMDFPSDTDWSDIQDDEFLYNDAITAFDRDHCEVFWLDYSLMKIRIRTEGNGVIRGVIEPSGRSYLISCYSGYDDVQADCELLESQIKSILLTIKIHATKYDELKTIHDWLAYYNSYNIDGIQSGPLAFKSLSAIEGNDTGSRRPVCEGYARAFKLLCDRLSIPCMLVSGVGINNNHRESHMWNYVQLNGKWYAVDVTWDDGIGGFTTSTAFFLVGADTDFDGLKFSQSHVEDPYIGGSGNLLGYPKLNAEAYTLIPQDGTHDTASGLLLNFTKVNSYYDGIFRDVKASDWYSANVKAAYELNLIIGNGDGNFGVNSNLTLAETLTIAAKLHSIYYGKTISTAYQSRWYEPFVNYCLENGIISAPFDNYDKAATRAEFADILANAFPASALEMRNSIPDGAIPDVSSSAAYADNVYLLYRAGVLCGNDEYGTFGPDTNILRSHVASIITRMADVSLRVSFSL